MSTAFENIYTTDEWGCGSGQGSLPEYTRGYAAYLERFIRDHGVRSVVDVGCGDWQFSRYIDWGSATYHGLDVVGSVIERNQQEFAREGVEFSHYSGDPSEAPAADLLICKDVLQHLADDYVHDFLPILDQYRYALITNCVDPKGAAVNAHDIEDGGFRYLDLRRPPFGLQAEEVFTFEKPMHPLRRLFQKPKWQKRVLLVDNSPAEARGAA